MNRIVREHDPVERLPEDLRRLLTPAQPVRLTLEQTGCDEAPAPSPSSSTDMPLSRIVDDLRHRRVLSDDPVARVRALRDQWSERDGFHERIRAIDGN